MGVETHVVDFDEWVAARGEDLFRFAYVLTGNRVDAEDVLQEVLSRALPRWDRIRAVDDPDAYVRRMVVNAHISWWRRFRRRETPVAEVRLGTTDDPDVEEQDRVWRACLQLPVDQRVAVVLRYYEQLDYADIADLTRVREGTVRSRVSRGLATLRERLEVTDGD
ncbi:SigE family RNA polymerase sigma factor [Nocardioides coralli]|nr:SigE family RNA polymerase sigma factor [Nocardioides coralli]